MVDILAFKNYGLAWKKLERYYGKNNESMKYKDILPCCSFGKEPDYYAMIELSLSDYLGDCCYEFFCDNLTLPVRGEGGTIEDLVSDIKTHVLSDPEDMTIKLVPVFYTVEDHDIAKFDSALRFFSKSLDKQRLFMKFTEGHRKGRGLNDSELEEFMKNY